jgi:hypothetical protein
VPNDDRSQRSDPDDGLHGLADASIELAGALAGGALGLVGGPVGALGGAALGVAVQRGASAVLGRLRDRERQRAEATLVLIAADAQEHRERNEPPRRDGFFDSRDSLRPDAEEILEGVLRHAAETWEERKLPYLAHLYGSVAHDPSILPETAVFLLHIADGLTYRQMLALAARFDLDSYNEVAVESIEDHGQRKGNDLGVYAEEDALVERGLLGVRNVKSGDVVHPSVLWGDGRSAPRVLTKLGRLLASTLRLDLVPQDEMKRWADFDLRQRPSARYAPTPNRRTSAEGEGVGH